MTINTNMSSDRRLGDAAEDGDAGAGEAVVGDAVAVGDEKCCSSDFLSVKIGVCFEFTSFQSREQRVYIDWGRVADP